MAEGGLTVAAALVGALVGGFASAAGSYLFARAQRRQALRTELHRELLPALLDRGQPRSPNFHSDVYEAVALAAVAASRRDQRHGDSIARAVEAFHEAHADVDPYEWDAGSARYVGDEGSQQLINQRYRELTSAVDSYRRFLAKRVR